MSKNISLLNAKRVAAKLNEAGIIVNRMGKRNGGRYSLQVVKDNEAAATLKTAIEHLLTKEKVVVKAMKSGVVRVLVAPTRDEKGHYIAKSA